MTLNEDQLGKITQLADLNVGDRVNVQSQATGEIVATGRVKALTIDTRTVEVWTGDAQFSGYDGDLYLFLVMPKGAGDTMKATTEGASTKSAREFERMLGDPEEIEGIANHLGRLADGVVGEPKLYRDGVAAEKATRRFSDSFKAYAKRTESEETPMSRTTLEELDFVLDNVHTDDDGAGLLEFSPGTDWKDMMVNMHGLAIMAMKKGVLKMKEFFPPPKEVYAMPFADAEKLWWEAAKDVWGTDGAFVVSAPKRANTLERVSPNYGKVYSIFKDKLLDKYGYRPERTKEQSMMAGIKAVMSEKARDLAGKWADPKMKSIAAKAMQAASTKAKIKKGHILKGKGTAATFEAIAVKWDVPERDSMPEGFTEAEFEEQVRVAYEAAEWAAREELAEDYEPALVEWFGYKREGEALHRVVTCESYEDLLSFYTE